MTIEKFKLAKAENKEKRDQLRKQLKDVFAAAIKELFDKYPLHLAQIYWTQYTPYFNDGDSCEFLVQEVYVNGTEIYDYDYDPIDCVRSLYTPEELEFRTNWKPDHAKRYDYLDFETGLSPERIKIFDEVEAEVKAFMGLFDSDDFEYMFGDHVKITITKLGINVEEYSHD